MLLPLTVEVGGIGIFEIDLEQGRTRFSAELCAILRLPAGAEMTYEEASRLFDERDREMIQASVEAVSTAQGDGKWSEVCRVVRTDGAVSWVSIHGRRIYRGATPGSTTARPSHWCPRRWAMPISRPRLSTPMRGRERVPAAI
jgi:PAS domain-containing protein